MFPTLVLKDRFFLCHLKKCLSYRETLINKINTSTTVGNLMIVLENLKKYMFPTLVLKDRFFLCHLKKCSSYRETLINKMVLKERR